MKRLIPDPSRLDVLQKVCLREKAALQSAVDVVGNLTVRSAELRREILNLQRQEERSGKADVSARIEERRLAKKELEAKAEYEEQTVEIARERHNAALRLKKSCEEYLAGARV